LKKQKRNVQILELIGKASIRIRTEVKCWIHIRSEINGYTAYTSYQAFLLSYHQKRCSSSKLTFFPDAEPISKANVVVPKKNQHKGKKLHHVKTTQLLDPEAAVQ
jgi:hypothetical protein